MNPTKMGTRSTCISIIFLLSSSATQCNKARFSCILVNFTCRFEDSPSVPERSYEQSVDILGYNYASISHVSTNYPLNFYTLSIDNSFMKVLKNAKSEMPTIFHSILPSKLPMGRMLLQCPILTLPRRDNECPQ